MVREPHHERDCSIVNSSIYPLALSLSKGSEHIATQSLTERNEARVPIFSIPLSLTRERLCRTSKSRFVIPNECEGS
jgi:hypothetical protein